MNFEKGDYVVFEHKDPNNGIRRYCLVLEVRDGWVVDSTSGVHSQSFRVEDVVIWEHRKAKKSK